MAAAAQAALPLNAAACCVAPPPIQFSFGAPVQLQSLLHLLPHPTGADLQVQSLLTYWSANSLPMRKDGVFRAVPNSAMQVRAPRCTVCLGNARVPSDSRPARSAQQLQVSSACFCVGATTHWHPCAQPLWTQEGDKVVAQFGAWSAIVSVGGELFQASPLGGGCSAASLHSCRACGACIPCCTLFLQGAVMLHKDRLPAHRPHPAPCWPSPFPSSAIRTPQAFFDTHEAANAAFEAAQQSRGKGLEEAPAPSTLTRRATSAEPSAGTAAAAGAGEAGAAGGGGMAAPAEKAGAPAQREQQPVKEEQPQQPAVAAT